MEISAALSEPRIGNTAWLQRLERSGVIQFETAVG